MNSGPFYFYTRCHLVRMLSLKATTPEELLEGIKKAPLSSIYYHTHRFLQQHHYLSPEPPNDFAFWLSNALNLKELGEAFASVDTVRFKNIEELRSKFISILSAYLSSGRPPVYAPRGMEFHFLACTTFILPTRYVAHNLKEFLEIISKISIDSLYFHIFEAKMRLEKEENDFTYWLRGVGEEKLAEELSRLDPYTMTLEGLRQKIISIVKKYV